MPVDWLPLESNPDVINPYMKKSGVEDSEYEWVDVLATEEWALEMVPRPVRAVTLLYVIKDCTEAAAKEEKERIEREGQEVDPSIWFTKQTVGNACGTIALLHAIANNRDVFSLQPGSFFADFLTSAGEASTPEQRAAVLEASETAGEIHAEVAQQGQSEVIENTWQHFIVFVCVGGKLYELDGRKPFPVCHGASSYETLLEDAAKVARQFMDRDPEELRFTLMALAKKPAAEEGEAKEEEGEEGSGAAATA